jgi:hypothetical protein
VKGWYTYCMGPAAYDLFAWGNGGPGAWRRSPATRDPSAWANGGPGAWCRGHSATARVPASLLVSLLEFGNLPQWLISFSGAIESKGGYNEGAIGVWLQCLLLSVGVL